MKKYDYRAADELYGIHEFVARYVRTDLREADGPADHCDEGRDRSVALRL
jgi:hypothetical protein